MLINLSDNTGLISKYYLQTLVLLYLPCEKFSQKQKDPTSLEVSLNIQDKKANVTIYLQTKQGKAESDIIKEFDTTPDSEELQTLIGRQFLFTAEKIFGYLPPFGIFTGIRPAKKALLLLENKNEEETISYLTNALLMTKEKAEICTKIASFEKPIIESLDKRSFSLYISIPFCPTRCRYCSFVSYSTKRLNSLLPNYLEQLILDINKISKITSSIGLNLKSIYIGGGTPTVLEANQLEILLEEITRNFNFSSSVEFTVECGRPDTIDIEKLLILKKHGVNRISINTQSTNNEILSFIGRNHTYEDYLSAFYDARQVGFRSINTDLIAGLPKESKESFIKSIDQVSSLSPENITVHSFSLKRSSEFIGENYIVESNPSEISEMISYAYKKLDNSSYMPYYIYRQKNTAGNMENTGFAKKGTECMYNVYMMEELHSVFSAGAGAVTKLVSSDRKRISRIFTPKYPYEYLDREKYKGIEEKEILYFYENTF